MTDRTGTGTGATEAEARALDWSGTEIARLRVLDTVWSVRDHASGIQDDVPALWSRCITDEEPDVPLHLVAVGEAPPAGEAVVVAGEQGGYSLASWLIAASIGRHIGQSLMVHAAALTAPGTDRALCLVAASGTGKTTASRVLAQAGWGYLTDECVAVDDGYRVMPLEKPLSVVTDPRGNPHHKHQLGPDQLGMARAPEGARLTGLVLLHRLRTEEQREADPGPLPRLEPVPAVEALPLLAPQTSALSRTPGGLSTLARAVTDLGVQRLVYSEITETTDLLADLAAQGAPSPAEELTALQGDAPWDAVPPKPLDDPDTTPGARWEQAPFSWAVVCGEGDVVLMVGSSVLQLGQLGATLWQELADSPRTVGELTALLVETFGPHPDAERLAAEAVAALYRVGLVRPA
ncbi:hypothetical protein ACFFHC_11525 [Kytococcus schroeteri]|uniref:hypothetical protein n=1 Tax=Kytococcus schroeteri TaxID=138300 RepID=UPI0035E9B3D9